METFPPERMNIISKSPRKYPPELNERACRLVHDWRSTQQRSNGGLNEAAVQFDVHPESLRTWFKQWQVDRGESPGLTTEDQRRVHELESHIEELERSNAILPLPSAFFAADPGRPRDARGLHRRTPSRVWDRADLRRVADRFINESRDQNPAVVASLHR